MKSIFRIRRTINELQNTVEIEELAIVSESATKYQVSIPRYGDILPLKKTKINVISNTNIAEHQIKFVCWSTKEMLDENIRMMEISVKQRINFEIKQHEALIASSKTEEKFTRHGLKTEQE